MDRYIMKRIRNSGISYKIGADTYLEHFGDAWWLVGAILVDVGAVDQIGVCVGLFLLAAGRQVVPQLGQQLPGHERVEVVDEDLL